MSDLRLVAFDMDGTLVPGTTADLVYASLLGIEDEVADLERRYRAGALDSAAMARHLASSMSELTPDFVDRHFHRLPRVKGIPQVLAELRRRDVRSLIVTASNVLYARGFQRSYGFDHVFGCEHEVTANGNIGIARATCSGTEKVARVSDLVRSFGWTLKQVVAVGDSRDDAPLLAAAGRAIAFNPENRACLPAEAVVRGDDLRALLPVLFPA